jgi:threonine dehydratase
MTVTIDDIKAAAERISEVAVQTPLLSNRDLDEQLGGRVLFKPECLQVTGSFKIRGAYNLLAQLSAEEAQNGMVAWSSGNHAQGVAAAGSMLGIRTTIVMPEDAPRAKIENTRRLGGETVLYDRYSGDRELIAKQLAAERGAGLVPSFDHEDIIAGQGTVGLEIMQQCAELDLVPDQILVPCSGGGLSAGVAVAAKAAAPGTTVHTVEPEDFDDTARSIAAGQRESNTQPARSICDALQVATPGEITFDIMRQVMSEGLSVSDDQVKDAMRFAFTDLKLVIEPGGAAALAALLAGKIEARDRVTVVILSGGNVDPEMFAAIQREAAEG